MSGPLHVFDLCVFRGRAVDCVRFTANQVIVYFGRDLYLQMEDGYVLRFADGSVEHVSSWESYPLLRSRAIALIGSRVRWASSADGYTLTIAFESGASLVCSTGEALESYQIVLGGVTRVLV